MSCVEAVPEYDSCVYKNAHIQFPTVNNAK